MRQLKAVARREGELDQDRFRFLLTALKEIKAQDPIEWMLAMQIVTAHAATMRAARRLTFSETFVETEYTEKVYNKLSRTVAHLVPELRNLREF